MIRVRRRRLHSRTRLRSEPGLIDRPRIHRATNSTVLADIAESLVDSNGQARDFRLLVSPAMTRLLPRFAAGRVPVLCIQREWAANCRVICWQASPDASGIRSSSAMARAIKATSRDGIASR